MLRNGEAMSDNLLEYSGLVTKTKAMSGRLLKEADYARLMEYETVDALLGFLKNPMDTLRYLQRGMRSHTGGRSRP